MLFRRFDRHQAELEALLDDFRIEFARVLHRFDLRANFAFGKFTNRCAEQLFFFG